MSSDVKSRKIYPVILAVPPAIQSLKGRQKVTALSRHARRALDISARKSGLHLPETPKDEEGVPIPLNNVFWSITHKSGYVGGVAATSTVGIDIERLRPCSEALFRRIADQDEWALHDTDPILLFFRYWTAKESVLKALGVGIKGLSRCKIRGITDNEHLLVEFDGNPWPIEHYYFDGHIAAVTPKSSRVHWCLET